MMRARHMLRASSAVKLLAGAVLSTLAAASVILGSVSAVARGAQGSPQTASQASPTDALSLGHVKPAAVRFGRRSGRRMSRFLVTRDVIMSPSGGMVVVHGFLIPRRRGAQVKLMARSGRDWRMLATGRTHGDGRFRILYRVHGIGTTAVRVAFTGARHARAASADVGRIIALAPTMASWYDDAGNTACGFHATYGVANKTLPCGSKVTLSYGGRTVTATVDDRGPYVYGRSFDLNQNTARVLGMWGVARVLASV